MSMCCPSQHRSGPICVPALCPGARGATLCPHAMPCPKRRQPCPVPCRAPTRRRRAVSQRRVPPTIPAGGTSAPCPRRVSPSRHGRLAGCVCPVSRPPAGPWLPGRPPRPPRAAPRTHLARDASTRGRRRRRGRARASREAGGGRRRGERAGRRPGGEWGPSDRPARPGESPAPLRRGCSAGPAGWVSPGQGARVGGVPGRRR